MAVTTGQSPVTVRPRPSFYAAGRGPIRACRPQFRTPRAAGKDLVAGAVDRGRRRRYSRRLARPGLDEGGLPRVRLLPRPDAVARDCRPVVRASALLPPAPRPVRGAPGDGGEASLGGAEPGDGLLAAGGAAPARPGPRGRPGAGSGGSGLRLR